MIEDRLDLIEAQIKVLIEGVAQLEEKSASLKTSFLEDCPEWALKWAHS